MGVKTESNFKYLYQFRMFSKGQGGGRGMNIQLKTVCIISNVLLKMDCGRDKIHS